MRTLELHAPAKQVQRSKGRSSVAAAAYRTAERLEDVRTGETHDYTRKQGVEFTRLYVPDDAPMWAHDREKLWNAAEAKENRSNSMTAREYEIAFPAEFNAMQRREAGDAIARELMRRYNCAVDVAYHQPSRDGDQRNFHAHLLYTTRGFDEARRDGWARNKYRDVSSDPIGYDANGDPLHDQEGKKITRATMEVANMRHFFAGVMNNIAERDRLEVYVEHLSFKERGIDREPTQHLGPHASQMEKDGRASIRGDINREIQAANDNREIRVKREDFTKARAVMEHRREMLGYFAARHKDYGVHKAELLRSEAALLEARERAASATFFDRVRQRHREYEADLEAKRQEHNAVRQRLFDLVDEQSRSLIMRGNFAPFHGAHDHKVRDAMRQHREELANQHKERQAELKSIEDGIANRSRAERIIGAISGKARIDEARADQLRDEARIYKAREKEHERFLEEAQRVQQAKRGTGRGAGGDGLESSGHAASHGYWDSITFWQGPRTKDPGYSYRPLHDRGDPSPMQDNFQAANRDQRIQANKDAFLARMAETRDREQADRSQAQDTAKAEEQKPENMTREQRVEAHKQAFLQRAQEQKEAPGRGDAASFEGSPGQSTGRKMERE